MSENELWAASGAMMLTGRAAGPALLGTGSPVSVIRDHLDTLANAGGANLPDITLLGERAALSGLGRNAPRSVGGAFKILPAREGWLGLTLARPSDLDLVPALIQAAVTDPWHSVAEWLCTVDAAEATDRARLLGLPAAPIPVGWPSPGRRPVQATTGGARRRVDTPLVVDLSALWAGPLCAHLLALVGARVVKVESTTRADGARRESNGFYDLLHEGHESVVLDFTTQRPQLRALVRRADIIIEGSRPRALEQLGIDAAVEVQRGAIWVSITAGGRGDPLRLGFGDDIAAGAGLVVWDDGVPCPMGDALADPLTGVTAAAAAAVALAEPYGALLDVSMHDVCAAAARIPATGRRGVSAQPPASRQFTGQARPAGADTASVLAELQGPRRER